MSLLLVVCLTIKKKKKKEIKGIKIRSKIMINLIIMYLF
jgi:hypothetical protein